MITTSARAGAADATSAMSNKPEVQAMTPAADATNVDPATSFTLTFSEPVMGVDRLDFTSTLTGSATATRFATGIVGMGSGMVSESVFTAEGTESAEKAIQIDFSLRPPRPLR